MARRMEHPAFQATNAEGIAFPKQPVKLAAVTGEFGTGVERLAEDFLHINDVGTDAGLTPSRSCR